MNFRSWRIAFGWVPKSEDAVQKRFNMEKLPGLLLFYVDPGSKPDEKGGMQIRIQPYGGPMQYKYMKEFVTSVGSALGAKPEGEERTSQDYARGFASVGFLNYDMALQNNPPKQNNSQCIMPVKIL